MALEDIERLKERVEKDPGSKLFVALAEEYKKIGMHDEAIEILIQGLERLPNYMSARVSLGKVYLEKGMLNEAAAEFKQVVSSIPENLYAHKKLAEIYRDLGEKDKAINEFRAVLSLNPEDEEASKNLAELEGRFPIQQGRKRAEEMPEEDITELPIGEKFMSEPEKRALEEEEDLTKAGEESKQILSTEEVKKESEISLQPQVSIEDAEASISRGKYMEAMDVYEQLLSIEPDNFRILQRMEELKTLLKLLGKDKELIARLNSFLEGIKKRKDELFGNLKE